MAAKNAITATEAKKPAKKGSMEDFMQVYDQNLPGVLSANLEIQEMALERIRDTIGEADAMQAARIYGILSDKMVAVTGKRENVRQTYNLYLSGETSRQDQEDLIAKVMGRMKEERAEKEKEAAVDAEFKVENPEA